MVDAIKGRRQDIVQVFKRKNGNNIGQVRNQSKGKQDLGRNMVV